MASYFPTAVYLLCFLTCSVCAGLLGRAWWRSKVRISSTEPTAQTWKNGPADQSLVISA